MGAGMLTTQSMLKSLMSEIGTPHLISAMTLDQSAKWVTMLRMGAFATGKSFISQDLDALMLLGTNPVISHQGTPLNSASGWNPGKALRDAKRGGTKLIVVDPRNTETARMADIHLQIIPGQDAALMAGVIKILPEHGWDGKEVFGRVVFQLVEHDAGWSRFCFVTCVRRGGYLARLDRVISPRG